MYLRCHRPEALDGGSAGGNAHCGRRNGLHHRGLGLSQRAGPGAVYRALRGLRYGRIFYGQGQGRPDHLRRPFQACGGLPRAFSAHPASARPRGVSRRRVLPAQPSAGACGTPGPRIRRRQLDGAAHHRDAGRRRFGLHPHERHLHYGRPDLFGNRAVPRGRDACRQPGHFGVPRGRQRADQGNEKGGGHAEAGVFPVP